jgi:hypothetical protein
LPNGAVRLGSRAAKRPRRDRTVLKLASANGFTARLAHASSVIDMTVREALAFGDSLISASSKDHTVRRALDVVVRLAYLGRGLSVRWRFKN